MYVCMSVCLWYGLLWYGMVWCGVVWYGAVWVCMSVGR